MPSNVKLEQKVHNTKVVHLDTDTHKVVRSKLARLPAPIHATHEKSKLLLLGLVKTFFDRTDDALFELADKAESNQEQNLYFESMRQVRVERRGIEKRFSGTIDEAFAAMVTPGPDRPEGPVELEAVDTDALSLVENEELEEMVAFDSTVAKANGEFGESIQLLSLRFDSLVPVKIYQKNNPLSPDIICGAFMEEAKRLDIGIKAKLVLFKLFDKAVVYRLGELYTPINQLLIDHNVLPSLSAAAVRRGGKASKPSTSVKPGEPSGIASTFESVQTEEVDPQVFNAIQDMIGQQRPPQAQESPQGQSDAPSPDAAAPEALNANELIKLLSQIQQKHSADTPEEGGSLNVRSLLAEQQHGADPQLGRVDDEVMNLVNMLFDFILEDRNLAAPMKTLISRMQIPIIKVAVADKSFFTKGGHVARRLLNEMATSCIGWKGEAGTCHRDPLYRKINGIVSTLMNSFDTDVSIFNELLADFTAFLEKERRRFAVLERRVVDAEDGKAKAEVARKVVATEIELRTTGHILPDVVDRLISEPWSNVLFVTYLKHGAESQEWEVGLKTLEELVWSVSTPSSVEQRRELIRLVPGLLKKLRAGLDNISYNPYEMSTLFKSLEDVHLACIRGKSAVATTAKEPVAKSVETKPIETKPIETPSPDINPLETPPSEPIREDAPEVSAVETAAPANDELVVEGESTPAASPKEDASEVVGEGGALPESDEHMQQVSRFVQGTWFDIVEEGENMRCRLAAYIKPTGKYIFVNRNGMKVAEKTRSELAQALKRNELTALDNSTLFDRALETVVTGLRKN